MADPVFLRESSCETKVAHETVYTRQIARGSQAHREFISPIQDSYLRKFPESISIEFCFSRDLL